MLIAGLAGGEQRAAVRAAVDKLRGVGVRTSLFIDPDDDAIRHSVDVGAEAVEFHTGEYANSGGEERLEQLARVRHAASLARELDLAVHAGHGLTYENVVPVAALTDIEELNIGHSVVARAVLVGMERAVREMKETVQGAPARVEAPGEWVPPIGY